MSPSDLGRTLAALAPGAIPAVATTAATGLAGAVAGAPLWLQLLAQAVIVSAWSSNAARAHQKATTDELAALRDAVRGLPCVRAAAVAQVEGLTSTPPPVSCGPLPHGSPTPPLGTPRP